MQDVSYTLNNLLAATHTNVVYICSGNTENSDYYPEFIQDLVNENNFSITIFSVDYKNAARIPYIDNLAGPVLSYNQIQEAVSFTRYRNGVDLYAICGFINYDNLHLDAYFNNGKLYVLFDVYGNNYTSLLYHSIYADNILIGKRIVPDCPYSGEVSWTIDLLVVNKANLKREFMKNVVYNICLVLLRKMLQHQEPITTTYLQYFDRYSRYHVRKYMSFLHDTKILQQHLENDITEYMELCGIKRDLILPPDLYSYYYNKLSATFSDLFTE